MPSKVQEVDTAPGISDHDIVYIYTAGVDPYFFPRGRGSDPLLSISKTKNKRDKKGGGGCLFWVKVACTSDRFFEKKLRSAKIHHLTHKNCH